MKRAWLTGGCWTLLCCLAGCRATNCAVPQGSQEQVMDGSAPLMPQACAPKRSFGHMGHPEIEVRPQKTVHVKGPQQHIVINKNNGSCEPEPKRENLESSPQRAAAMQQEVLLVPKTVYVPYVAQTPVSTARLVGLQQQPLLDNGQPGAIEALKKEIENLKRQNQTKPEEKKEEKKCAPPVNAECTWSPTQPTTVIEIRHINDRIDRLSGILEKLCHPGSR